MFKELICFAFPVAISDIVACAEEQILTDNNQPDMDDGPGGDNLDDEGEAMVEEALSGTLSTCCFLNLSVFSRVIGFGFGFVILFNLQNSFLLL